MRCAASGFCGCAPPKPPPPRPNPPPPKPPPPRRRPPPPPPAPLRRPQSSPFWPFVPLCPVSLRSLFNVHAPMIDGADDAELCTGGVCAHATESDAAATVTTVTKAFLLIAIDYGRGL